MARATRRSKALEKAESRIKGMKNSGALIDCGNGVSTEAYIAKTEALRQMLDQYNDILTTLDESLRNIVLAEQDLNDFSEHMLLAIAAIYGKQSNQYARSGGSRKQSGGRIDRQIAA